MNTTQLIQDLIRDEDKRAKPYRCSKGKLTIGIGRNLDDRGLSEDEIQYLAANDIRIVEAELDRNVPWWRGLSEARQRALANMAFNLGWPRLSGFKLMLGALQRGDWEEAANQALDSLWANQVGKSAPNARHPQGQRAWRIAELFRHG